MVLIKMKNNNFGECYKKRFEGLGEKSPSLNLYFDYEKEIFFYKNGELNNE